VRRRERGGHARAHGGTCKLAHSHDSDALARQKHMPLLVRRCSPPSKQHIHPVAGHFKTTCSHFKATTPETARQQGLHFASQRTLIMRTTIHPLND
jgi:hypothetical protein